MVSRFGKVLSLTLALLLTFAASARAQWSVTPYIGYYIPTGDVMAGNADFVDFPGFRGEFAAENGSGFGFGGMIAYTQPSGLGFEFGLGYYQSDLSGEACAFDDTGDQLECERFEQSGSVIPLTGRVSYRFSAPTATTQFYGAAGLAYLLRGGDAWDSDAIDKNQFGGTLAVGMLYPLSPMLKLRVELTDFLYSSSPLDNEDIEGILEDAFEEDADGGSAESKFNNDFSLNVGVTIPFGGS